MALDQSFTKSLGTSAEDKGFTTTFHESFRGAYPPKHEWDGTKIRFQQPDGSWGVWKDTREGLGEAATKDVGTEADRVPLNSDLGSAATRDVGTASSELPDNASLGSAAYEYVGNAGSEIPTYDILEANGLIVDSLEATNGVTTGTVSEKTEGAGIDYAADEHRFDSMPTVAGDAVVESGSNSNGSWTKWADGTMIASIGELTATFDTNYRLRGTWTYPEAFSVTPNITVSMEALPTQDNNDVRHSLNPHSSSANEDSVIAELHSETGDWSNGDECSLSIIAIGKWK